MVEIALIYICLQSSKEVFPLWKKELCPANRAAITKTYLFKYTENFTTKKSNF